MMKYVTNLRAICILLFSVSIHSIDFKAFTQDDFNVSSAVYPGTSTSISTLTPNVFEEEEEEEEEAEEDCTIVDCIIPTLPRGKEVTGSVKDERVSTTCRSNST